MSKASTVAVAGGALIAVNAWVGPQHQAIADTLNGKRQAQQAAHTAWLQIAGEALAVLVAIVAAGSSDSVGNGMIAAVVALWVLFGITYYTRRQAGARPAASAQPTPQAAAA